jgi:uncharacterized protein YkwD
MHRVSEHREPDARSRRVLLIVVPVVLLAIVGVLLGRSLLGSRDTASAASALTAQAPAAEPEATETTAAVVENVDLGVRKGQITLTGPTDVADDAHVVFVLIGSKELRRTDLTSPYSVKIDSTELPNGKYTIEIQVVDGNGDSTVATTGTVEIKNPKPKPTKTVAPTPSPTPTPNKNNGGSGSGGSSGGNNDNNDDDNNQAAVDTSAAGQILALVNTERAKKNNCRPLTLNSKLNKAAQAHTVDMATHNFFDHNSRDGRSPFDRITAAGYRFSSAAENIAAGSSTAAATMNQWMNSPGHKANILNCGFKELGVGHAKGVNADFSDYWTQDFGTRL